MTLNELRQLFQTDPHTTSMYFLTADVKIVDSEQLLTSVEYTDGSKDEIHSDVPEILPKESMIQIHADSFTDNPNLVKGFDGLNLLTLEVEDPDQDFVEDALECLFGKDEPDEER